MSFAYDPVNRLTEATDGLLNETTRYAYDPAGNRIRTERKKANRITTYTYGKANELLSVTDPDGKTTGYRYDALVRETYRKTPNDVATETVYDPAGRISAIKSFEKKRGHNTVLSSFAYLCNEAGEQTFRIDEKGEVMSFAYDAAGRIAEVRYPFESGKPETDFEQRLNFGLYPEEKTSTSRGNKRHGDGDEGMSFALPQIDNDHELKERLKERSVPRMGVYKKYRGLSSHEHPRWHVTPVEGATPFATRLNLDPETKNQLQDAYREINPYNRRFNDHQYQWTETFGYDTRNNLSTSANGWGRVDYSYDEAHRLTQTGNRNYLHDANGNLIKEYLGEEDGPLSADYTYTPENRIAQIETHFDGFLPGQLEADSGVRYTYDALGRRSSRASYLSKSYGFHKQLEWNRESTETYLYEALSFDILAEYRDTEYEVNRRSRHFFPSFSNRFKPIAEYITANGRHLSRTEFAESSWGRLRCKDKDYYLQDVLGSVVGVTDERGNQREEYSFDVWGKEFHKKNGHPYSDIFPTHYGYNGKRFDPKVGLYDYGFRDYKPAINRWTTIDPIRSGTNWYAYVGNDPVNWVDPLGLEEAFFTGSSTFTTIIPISNDPLIVSSFSVTVDTDVIVNTATKTATVSATTTTQVYEAYETTSVTQASLNLGEATLDTGTLSYENAEATLTAQGSASLGEIELDLPDNYEDLDLTVTTSTSYIISSANGAWLPGTQNVTVELEFDTCSKANK
ncbi:RHS repeat-associated core domain-containing protein [Marispirochaeta sp.]|uniref:RHS repeat-associated core domain-containing protein n=1 Tax=Marispirochaeta sp. TaxID=2038653 RepID=UPI0029C69C81|nr:RHS repeat-associated core domain-containing protein [Marispirochaeta sp.]